MCASTATLVFVVYLLPSDVMPAPLPALACAHSQPHLRPLPLPLSYLQAAALVARAPHKVSLSLLKGPASQAGVPVHACLPASLPAPCSLLCTKRKTCCASAAVARVTGRSAATLTHPPPCYIHTKRSLSRAGHVAGRSSPSSCPATAAGCCCCWVTWTWRWRRPPALLLRPWQRWRRGRAEKTGAR